MALAVGALFSTAVLVLIPEVSIFFLAAFICGFLRLAVWVNVPKPTFQALKMIDMPREFGGQGRTYLYKFICVPVGALFFFLVEYVLLILPRLLRVRL